MGLSTGLPHKVAAGLPGEEPSKRERELAGDESCSLFYNPVLEMTLHHLCHILFLGIHQQVQPTLEVGGGGPQRTYISGGEGSFATTSYTKGTSGEIFFYPCSLGTLR